MFYIIIKGICYCISVMIPHYQINYLCVNYTVMCFNVCFTQDNNLTS